MARASRLAMLALLNLHQRLYHWISRLAVRAEGGVHPKHRLMSYEAWFAAQIDAGSVVVDVGCNSGGMARVLAEKATHVYGIEIDKTLYEQAINGRQLTNLSFIQADATRFDYRACRAVDHVTLSNVLEHIDDRVGFLRRLVDQVIWQDPARKSLLIRVPMIDRDWLTLYKRELGVEYRLDPTHFTEYTQAQFERELADAGIAVRSLRIGFGELYAVCEAAR